MKSTTVRLNGSTKRRVERLGDAGDTWDSLLNDMCDFIEDREDEWWEEEEEE